MLALFHGSFTIHLSSTILCQILQQDACEFDFSPTPVTANSFVLFGALGMQVDQRSNGSKQTAYLLTVSKCKALCMTSALFLSGLSNSFPLARFCQLV